MKIIDCSKQEGGAVKNGGAAISALSQAQQKIFQSAAQKETAAQELVITSMQRFLDHKYFLLRNVQLEGLEAPIPMILVGPAGMRVININGAKGVFRAKEDIWEALDESSQRYRSVKPNLLTRTLLMSRAVDAFLSGSGLRPADSEAVLLFTNPGLHLDSTRPVVRVVMADALDRYVATLLQARQSLEPDKINRLVRVLSGQSDSPALIEETRDIFSFKDLSPDGAGRLAPEFVLDKSEPEAFKKVPFNRKQMLILGGLVLLNIIIVLALITIVYLTT